MLALSVVKTTVRLVPDPKRVITKPFSPGGDVLAEGRARSERILSRILQLSDAETGSALELVQQRFAGRHSDLDALFAARFEQLAPLLARPAELSRERKLLIGAYFIHEYSIEAAALSNPSMVLAPDQSGLAPGEQRFVMSLRAIGEGHISSIGFRSGVIDNEGQITMEATSRYATTARRRAPLYEKATFRSKLDELGADREVTSAVLGVLADGFTFDELENAIRNVDARIGHATETTRTIHWLAASNYASAFDPETSVSERVLFPAGVTESRGMEDARFVRFVREDKTVTYFATYTAFDGHQILPQLIETPDFVSFRIATLNGPSAKNKGIALFPRLIGGRYMALGRLDNENNFLMSSDNVRFWHKKELIQRPERHWEFIQLGNCGSPLETDAGWLVITHGVGAMRQYAIGAILLDREDPSRVIGHLSEPLLEPSADERDGYVPNVVYSCGSMISGKFLVLPYGFSDVGTRIATVRLDALLGALTAA